jgi:hypothetical protein
MKRLLLCLLFLALVCAAPALACPLVVTRTVTNYTPVSYTPTYVAPTVAVQIVPTYATILAYGLQVPAYGASFAQYSPYPSPPAAATVTPPSSACDAKLKELQQQIDDLKRLLPAPVPPPKIMGRASDASESLGASQYFAVRCASCHEAAVAVAKGKGLILHRNDGGPVKLTRENVAAILAQVESGKMPVDGPRATSAQMFSLRTELSSLVFNSP